MPTKKNLLEDIQKERIARLEAEECFKESKIHDHAELSRNIARFSNLISNMQEGILVEDENRLIVLTNERFCAMFGIPVDPAMLIGADCSGSAEQSKHFFTDPEGFVAKIDNLLNQKQKVIGEVLYLKDGRTYLRDYVPIIIEGSYRGHYWKYADITNQKRFEDALKRSEEKYRLLIENMNLGLLEVDLAGKIIYANQSFCNLSGFGRDEIYGKIGENIFTNAENRKLVRKKTASRHEGILDAYELEITTKQGLKKWWMISGAPLFDQEGIQIGSIGIHLDITEQKQLEFTLREAKQMAEETAKAKEIFLANMSHEIRTPMNAIFGLSNQMLKSHLDSKQRSFLESIFGAAENLLVVINDILDFSKIESGNLDIEAINFSLPKLLKQISGILTNKIEEKGLQLILQIDDSIAPVLVGDPFRLNQILLNLISNSIKFTDHGSISLICNVEESDDKQQSIKLMVTDTGIGIDKSFVEKIFHKFSQESADVARKYGGTGLGMAITKQLVDLMDGQISIESEKNKGTQTTLLFTLPIGKQAESPEHSKPVFNQAKLVNKKILLVEDNKVNRLIANTILSQYGIEVTEAINGELAVEILRKSSFDIVLMDIQMPVMDGITATIMIRKEINTTLPIIALTAHALQSEQQRCREAGMNDFLSKPFNEVKLLETILKHLD